MITRPGFPPGLPMGRILAIDYGLKRTGLAVTDPMRIIATPLETVSTASLLTYLNEYTTKETVDEFVVGMPKTLKNEDSEIAPKVRAFVDVLHRTFPDKKVNLIDERFTSRMAMQAMIEGGMKKKDRRDKSNVDKISATIILQSFLNAP
jgi:putative Holliday junction resolvase